MEERVHVHRKMFKWISDVLVRRGSAESPRNGATFVVILLCQFISFHVWSPAAL